MPAAPIDDVFLTGYSLRAPSSNNPREFYEHLRDGKDMTTPTRRYPKGYLGLPPRTGTLPCLSRFDQDFFKFSTKQTEKMDVAIRLLLEVTHEALMDAQLPVEQLRGTKTGVYVGHCFSDYLGRSTYDKSLTGYELVNGAHTMAANKLSYFYDLKGPSLAIDTACSSSLVALHHAVADIRSGAVDRAIVSGVSLTLDPRKNAIFNSFTMLSPTGTCYTFDTRANGYCRSEGVVTVVIESSRVCQGGVCRVLGTSVNSDGFKDKGITFPSGRDQAANAAAAMAAGKVSPNSIAYVEAHGTGTVAGDKQELDGLSRLFYGDAATGPEAGDKSGGASSSSPFRNIPIGSVKSAMGHAEGASGLMSVVKVLAMFEHKQLLPNQKFVETAHNPLLDGRFKVVTKLEPWKPGNVCISNYGFGGTNAFAVLAPGNLENLFLETTSTAVAPLKFSNSPTTSFEGVDQAWLAQQVALGNDKQFKYRGGKKVGTKGGHDKVCFVYGGQGSQWLCMGQKLMAESAEFKATIVRLTGFLKQLDPAVADLVALFEEGDKWMDKEFTVLGIVAYQVASTNLLKSAGIVPDFYMGHSLGETAAGYARGLQSEQETIQIAYVRSRLSSKIKPGGFVVKSKAPREGKELICTSKGFHYYDLPAAEVEAETDEVYDLTGQMVAVGLPADEITAAIGLLGLRQTCVACFNGPKGQTVSGAKAEVDKLKKHFLGVYGKESLFWREVDTDGVAYHAPHLECYFDFLVGEFEKILGKGARRPLDGMWVPTSTTPTAEEKEELVLDCHFHARNITNPVYFMQAIQSLPPNTLVVEVGSSQSLMGQVKRVRSDIGLMAGLVSRDQPDSEAVYRSSEALRMAFWEAGLNGAFPSAKPLPPSPAGWSPELAQSLLGHRHGVKKTMGTVASAPMSASATVEVLAVAGPGDMSLFGSDDDDLILESLMGPQEAKAKSAQKLNIMKQGGGTEKTAATETETTVERVPFNSRWPDLWDHSRLQRTFTYKDFKLKAPKERPVTEEEEQEAVKRVAAVAAGERQDDDDDDDGDDDGAASVPPGLEDGESDADDDEEGANGLGSSGKATVVKYDLAGKDAFLLDHRINGRALFPATGHLFTMWHAKGGLQQGQGVRFRDFEVLSAVVLDPKAVPVLSFGVAQLDGKLAVLHGGDVVARASFDLLPKDYAAAAAPKPQWCETQPPLPPSSWLERGQLYNHFKRYGYEYQTEFQLVTRRTVPLRLTGGGASSSPLLGCGELRGAAHVIPFLDNFLQLFLEELSMLKLPTLIRECELLPGAVAEAAKGAIVTIESASLTLSSECVTMRGLNTMPAAGPVHPPLVHDTHLFVALGDHSNARGDSDGDSGGDSVLCSSERELAGLVGLMRKEWHGCDHLTVVEGGEKTTGAFAQRLVPLLGTQLGKYILASSSSAAAGSVGEKGDDEEEEEANKLMLGSLEGNPKVKVSEKGDIGGGHHLIACSNSISHHSAAGSNVAATLAHFVDALVDGGMVLIEEPLYEAAVASSSSSSAEAGAEAVAGKQCMSWSQWLAAIDQCQGLLELLVCYRTQYRATMLLRKTTNNGDDSAAVLPATAWEELAEQMKTGAAPVVLEGAGAEGLVKTLRLEEGAMQLKALVDMDGSLAAAAATRGGAPLLDKTNPPLTFTAVKGGKVGSLVVVPLSLQEEEEIENSNSNSTSTSSNVQLHIVRPGDLSTLTWIQAPTTPDYSVQVAYSSLNFKDVMYAFGKLRLEQPSFGLEFSGTDLNSGKRVMGIGVSACIGKQTKPALCWEVPSGMGLDEAATIPVVYATALFALFEKARLRKGQTALIHAGSGGVGHAAIYLCQARGIEVFTTCSDSKRDYVLKTFGLDDAHVGSSRDTSFRETVLRATNGQGVDCVLNSLSGPMLDASLQCVKPYGHFCEIGKYDLQNNTLIGLKSLELNVSYHAVELSTMFKHPHLSVVLKGLLQEALDKREVVPLNHGVFEACDVEQALRFMSAGKHRGKVLVNMQGFTPTKEALRFTTSGTHIITGGLGGFGLELAKWLLEQGAAKVIATGRSGITTGWQKYRAEAIWAKFGSGALEVSHKDVRDEAQCTELLHAANGGGSGSVGVGGGSLKGVWHVAMVLQDTLFKNMTAEKWALSNGVKVQGVENLDRLTEEFFPRNQLDAFVAFSSVSSLFGNVGQANYAHANNACETVVAARAARGLKACAIQWGMIDNVGVLGQGASGSDAKVLETFLAFQNIDSSLNSLHTLVQAGGVVTSYRLSSNDNAGGDDGDGEAEAFELSIPTIQNKFAEILGGNGSDYDQDSPLNDYGLDSLSSIEVVNWMNRHTTRTVNPSFMTSDMTINKMHAHMAAQPK